MFSRKDRPWFLLRESFLEIVSEITLFGDEVAHYFFPTRCDLHNYSSANSLDQKRYNWNTLNVKVLKKLGSPLASI